MRCRVIKIACMLLIIITSFSVPAFAFSADRIFPASVNTGKEFQVTVNVADYGAAGQYLEKLPQGFIYSGSNLTEKAVTARGDKISFLLINVKSFSYTLKAPSSPGKYKFVGLLRDINKAGSSVLPTDSFIEVTAPSSGNSKTNSDENLEISVRSTSSNSSSNGAGSSPEPMSNIEAKELSEAFVTIGQHVKFEFLKDSTCIRYVEFDSRKTLGKVTTVVEMLKGQSKLVSSLPAGRVYKNVNIWMGAGGVSSPDNIENATIGFRVEKAWLEKNGNNSSSVALWHFNNTWSKLGTQKMGEDNTYIYFDARTPVFGQFVIALNNESTNMNSSVSNFDISVSPTSSGAKAISNTSKPAEKGSQLPGFESAVSVCILGAAYCILRRKN